METQTQKRFSGALEHACLQLPANAAEPRPWTTTGCCVVQADRCQRASGRAVPRRPVPDRPDITWPRDLHAETHPHGSEG